MRKGVAYLRLKKWPWKNSPALVKRLGLCWTGVRDFNLLVTDLATLQAVISVWPNLEHITVAPSAKWFDRITKLTQLSDIAIWPVAGGGPLDFSSLETLPKLTKLQIQYRTCLKWPTLPRLDRLDFQGRGHELGQITPPALYALVLNFDFYGMPEDVLYRWLAAWPQEQRNHLKQLNIKVSGSSTISMSKIVKAFPHLTSVDINLKYGDADLGLIFHSLPVSLKHLSFTAPDDPDSRSDADITQIRRLNQLCTLHLRNFSSPDKTYSEGISQRKGREPSVADGLNLFSGVDLYELCKVDEVDVQQNPPSHSRWSGPANLRMLRLENCIITDWREETIRALRKRGCTVELEHCVLLT
jgi:hypothetical protein